LEFSVCHFAPATVSGNQLRQIWRDSQKNENGGEPDRAAPIARETGNYRRVPISPGVVTASKLSLLW
jgi:hypothetical protein